MEAVLEEGEGYLRAGEWTKEEKRALASVRHGSACGINFSLQILDLMFPAL